MLRIEVTVNGRRIGVADAQNVSEHDSGPSTYVCSGVSEASPYAKLPRMTHQFTVDDHVREQSAWMLVAKMAWWMAEDAANRGAARSAGGENG